VEPGTPGLQKIMAQFGQDVLLPDGSLDRERLGRLVFGDAQLRKTLNGITHPEIRKAMMWQILWLFLKGTQLCIDH